MSLLLLALAFAGAQSNDVTVSGRITDPTGASVAHVAVKFYSRAGPEQYLAVSNNEGTYSLIVPKGHYLVDANGLQPLSIEVRDALDLPLRIAPGAVHSSVEVTATGMAQSLNETAKAIDLVDRSEIDQRAVASLADAVREVPGLRVEQRGGPGYNTTIQIRGLRTFDTAVLIDGMRFRDVGATQGDASSFLTDLLLVDTARVEVLRGAGSSVYGTNAIGGVINLVTDSGGGSLHGSITADGGGLGEFRGLARMGGGAFHERLHYSAGVGHQNVTDNVGGYGTYRNTTGNGLVDYTFKPGLVMGARLLGTDVFGQLYDSPSAAAAPAPFVPAPGDPDYYRTARFLSTLLYLQQQVSAPFSYRVSYQALLSDRNVVNGPLGPGFQPGFRTSNQFNGRIDTLRAQANYAAGAHNLLSAGYEFEREYFDSPSLDNNPNPLKQVNSRTQVSEASHTADAQDQIRLLRDRLQITLSGRLQHFDLSTPQFLGTVPVYSGVAAVNPPNAYTADVSVAYLLSRTGTKVRSHAGNGYRKPSLYELFGTAFSGSTFSAYGDPRLKPEHSVAIDGGFDQYFASDKVRVSGTYFYTRLQQVIAFDSSGLIQPATDLFKRSSGYRNTGGALARGVELSTEVRPLRSTRVTASYTYTNSRDRFSQFVDGTLQTPRISPHSASLVVLQQFGKHVDASVSFVAASDFLYQISRRTFALPGARQAAITAGYTRALNERVRMRWYGRINNLGDQVYYEDGYRTPRRWAVAGVTFSL